MPFMVPAVAGRHRRHVQGRLRGRGHADVS